MFSHRRDLRPPLLSSRATVSASREFVARRSGASLRARRRERSCEGTGFLFVIARQVDYSYGLTFSVQRRWVCDDSNFTPRSNSRPELHRPPAMKSSELQNTLSADGG